MRLVPWHIAPHKHRPRAPGSPPTSPRASLDTYKHAHSLIAHRRITIGFANCPNIHAYAFPALSMQAALEPFRRAYQQQHAFGVAATFAPAAPRDNPAQLYDFYKSTNEHFVETEIRSAISYRSPGLSKKESNAWTEIYVSYWRAVGEILKAEEASNQGRLGPRQYVDVYDAWKDLMSQFLKHTSSNALPPWSIICVYNVANNLRIFAIRADEQLGRSKGDVTFSSGFQDDIVSTAPRSEKLEEAARVFNRLFALCLGDRNPDMSQSRKWGTYYVANLQFKTYFKVTSFVS